MSAANRALMNLVLLAHAEIRALRDVIGLMMPAIDATSEVNAANWSVVEAECRRKHLEALGLPLDQFDALVGEALLESVEYAPKAVEKAQSPKTPQSGL